MQHMNILLQAVPATKSHLLHAWNFFADSRYDVVGAPVVSVGLRVGLLEGATCAGSVAIPDHGQNYRTCKPSRCDHTVMFTRGLCS